MTSDARPDEYEALYDKAELAFYEAGPHPSVQAAASILRDHVEAKLAEVRAERDAWQQEANSHIASLDDELADCDRTIAEQAAMIERLREALTLAANRFDRCVVDYIAGGATEAYAVGMWADEARTALQETTDGK